jgi:Raf kinase inhibitor-like YbhB/YbcL family protein
MRGLGRGALVVGVLTVAVCACAGAPSAASLPSSMPVATPPTPPVAIASLVPSAGSATMSPSTGSGLSPSPEVTMPDFTLTSTAFEPGGAIPKRYTCDGEDGSPDLAWTGAPDGTGALTLVVDDPDARGWVHWIVLDMAGSSSGALARGVGVSPDAPAQGRNDFGRIGWGGPCPPSGTHRYAFTLYALSEPLALPGQPDGAAVRKALGDVTVLGMAVLEATYRRGG